MWSAQNCLSLVETLQDWQPDVVGPQPARRLIEEKVRRAFLGDLAGALTYEPFHDLIRHKAQMNAAPTMKEAETIEPPWEEQVSSAPIRRASLGDQSGSMTS